MPKKKYYRTIIQIEVLSEDPYGYESLSQTAYDIEEGECSGDVKVLKTEAISGKEMAEALTAQGSDPEFFQLDEEGNPIE